MWVGLAKIRRDEAGWIDLAISSVPDAVAVDFAGYVSQNEVPRCDVLIVDPDSPGPNFLRLYKGFIAAVGVRPMIILGEPNHPLFRMIEWEESETIFLPKPYRLEDLSRVLRELSIKLKGKPLAVDQTKPQGADVQFDYLSTFQLLDLVQMLCLNRWEGRIHVREIRTQRTGEMFLGNGGVLDARQGESKGDEACYRMLAWGKSDYKLEENEAPSERSITTDWQLLLLEGAKRKDEGDAQPRELGS